jgi:hypothetical protein
MARETSPRFAATAVQGRLVSEVIRSPDELSIIREYVATNPVRWATRIFCRGGFQTRPYKCVRAKGWAAHRIRISISVDILETRDIKEVF